MQKLEIRSPMYLYNKYIYNFEFFYFSKCIKIRSFVY